MKFIKFFVSRRAYYIALIPKDGDAPRYLLPAYKQYYSDIKVTKAASLYKDLYPMALTIEPVTGDNLGYKLRSSLGVYLLAKLPK